MSEGTRGGDEARKRKLSGDEEAPTKKSVDDTGLSGDRRDASLRTRVAQEGAATSSGGLAGGVGALEVRGREI